MFHKFWDFLSGQAQDELDWHSMTLITGLRCNSTSDLVAFSCDDLSIRIVDSETKKIVRELWGCVGQINDFCFSNDGRWLIAASMDSVIRTWDLPTGHLIDAFRLQSTCTALAFSATGEFLATAHADGVGVSIWNNRSVFLHVPSKHIEEDDIMDVATPTASGEGGTSAVDSALEGGDDGESETGAAISIDQLSHDMVTLSIVPKSRWQSLLHLEAIKQRNKPIEPPKAPEKAPFFLPSLINGTKITNGNALSENGEVTAAERSRITKMERSGRESKFTVLLQGGDETADFDPLIEHLKTLSPSAADLEIRSLEPIEPYTELLLFISALTSRLRQKKDYELVNAWMAVFLRIHGEVLSMSEELVEALAMWRVELEKENRRLGDLVGYCSGIVGFLRSARV